MPRALWLLLWLRLRGWLRRLGRTMRTPKGAVLVLLGVLVVALWLLPSAFAPAASAERLEQVRRWGPLALVGFAVANLLFSAGEAGISFTPAEVTLLFPGPFTRRQLLLYKMCGMAGGALFSAAILTLFLKRHTAWWLAAFVGLAMTLLLLQLATMALALVGSTVGAAAYNRQRRLVLTLVILVVAVGLYQVGLDQLDDGWPAVLTRLERAPVVQTLLTPFGWFVRTLTAVDWSELAQWGSLAMAVDVGLVALILLLDAQFLETSAAASERLYARLERVRQGGTAAATLPGAGAARLAAPALPFWGGVGPLVWRQLTTALRSWRALLSLAILFGLTVGMFAASRNLDDVDALLPFVVSSLLMLTLFVPPLLPFDFRGDLDRIELLKTLPLPAWRLAIGQLLTPVLLVTLFQALALLIAERFWGQLEVALSVAIALLLPFNFLVFALENLLFLWFPSRLVAAGPGDFHMLGRQIVMWLAKIIGLGIALLPAGLLGLLVYLLTRNTVLAAIVGWSTFTAIVVGLVPLVALAFRHYDVARDTPA